MRSKHTITFAHAPQTHARHLNAPWQWRRLAAWHCRKPLVEALLSEGRSRQYPRTSGPPTGCMQKRGTLKEKEEKRASSFKVFF